MSKAYVRSMTRDFYSAGREAKKGKSDLETYLAARPDDPTATGLLGAFLYFADTIPGAFKFLSKLLLLPTGDREKGLEYLQSAARGGGVLGTDWKLVLFNVYFYFEGRFEEGLAGLEDVLGNYPEYARTAIPLAVARPYAPTLAVRNDEIVEATVKTMYSAPNREVDWNALYLVQLFRAFGDRYCNQSRATEARLRSIIHESPRHPDWIPAYARLELGRLYAARGNVAEAVDLFESVKATKGFDYLRKEAEILLGDVEKFGKALEGRQIPNMDEWVWALYRNEADSLVALRARFAELTDRSLAARFYLAECDLLSGDFDSALRGFDEVISVAAPAWEHPYQMIASTRIAEIYASRGYYKTAARYQGIALGYYHNEYLVDWVMEGRRRYFERLGEGKEKSPPTLLSANIRPDPPGGGATTDRRAQND
jgi:tetratricopeptide (TPR) repeat protein